MSHEKVTFNSHFFKWKDKFSRFNMKYLSVYNEVNKGEKTDFERRKSKICEINVVYFWFYEKYNWVLAENGKVNKEVL